MSFTDTFRPTLLPGSAGIANVLFGCSGGKGRASGWACDVRKRIPYGVYDKVDFKEIVYTEGDCFARYLVRMDEIMESLNIIEQLIDNIPEGPYQEKMKPIIRVPDTVRDSLAHVAGPARSTTCTTGATERNSILPT